MWRGPSVCPRPDHNEYGVRLKAEKEGAQSVEVGRSRHTTCRIYSPHPFSDKSRDAVLVQSIDSRFIKYVLDSL